MSLARQFLVPTMFDAEAIGALIPYWADGVSIGNRPVTANWQENSGVTRSRLAANGVVDTGHLWHVSDSPATRHARRWLEMLVGDPEASVRLAAMTQLAASGDAALTNQLRRRASQGADPAVRRLAEVLGAANRR